MIEFIVCALLIIASIVIFMASIGLLRMPDLPTRMHATTKAGVLGLTLIVLAVGIFFNRVDIFAKVLAMILFTMITAPIAAHAIGRAAYLSGVVFWSGTVRDELKEHYIGVNNKK